VLAQSLTFSSFVLAPTQDSLFSTHIIEKKRDFYQNGEKESNLLFFGLWLVICLNIDGIVTNKMSGLMFQMNEFPHHVNAVLASTFEKTG
jgi:hypothetical protein